jgi:UDP-N-acetyl-D-mannosaminuronic acid dehydrogenase
MEKVCVIGLGYVGLPTASLLAQKGFQVHGVDINPTIIETLKQGRLHIYEPDLEQLVKATILEKSLTVGTVPQEADVFILAVPTPFYEEQEHQPNLSYVKAATEAIASYLKGGNLVILESTSPAKTTENIGKWLQEIRPDLRIPEDVSIAHCPERVLPGKILEELVTNSRIVGGLDAHSADRAADFYRQFVTGEIFKTTARTAELTKLAENAFRDVNIAFANEMSVICDRLNVNVWELIALANHHPRVNILKPGPGVGGHCISVDPWFIVASAPEETKLIKAAREVNDAKPYHIVTKIQEKASQIQSPVIACLGLAYKADTDDLRQSPAIKIVQLLAERISGECLVVEPHITALPESLQNLESVQLVDLETAIEQADLIAFLVDHRQFKGLQEMISSQKILIDTKGVLQEPI